MKKQNLSAVSVILLYAAAAVLLAAAGCAQPEYEPRSITVPVPAEGYAYVNLEEAGVLEADAATDNTNWDLKIGSERIGLVFTNSGDTADAESSSGKGGVYYVADAADVESVSEDAVIAAKEVFGSADAEWNTNKHYDMNKWLAAIYMGPPTGDPAFPAEERSFNVMNFVGYAEGDGETADTGYADYQYNENQYYEPGDDHGTFKMTSHVYIIRHGNGENHSAIQITGMETSDTGKRTYAIQTKQID